MQFNIKIAVVVLFLFLFIITNSFAQNDPFSNADKNQNGVIDRIEFDELSNLIQNSLRSSLNFDKPKELNNNNESFKNQNRIPDSKNILSNSKLPDGKGFGAAFVSSIISIWATEIGDKTFFIAAILSMKYGRLSVFSGAIGALIAMTVLSVVLGGVVGYFLPKELTHYAGALLFVIFGIKMLLDAQKMQTVGPSGELAEVEEELEGKKTSDGVNTMECGQEKHSDTMTWMKVFSQSFLLTFLAEWGDRSQIATITLSTSKDPIGVTLGAIFGHSMCTGLAVVGGKLLASRISEKTVTLIGGVLFLLFAFHSFFFGVVE